MTVAIFWVSPATDMENRMMVRTLLIRGMLVGFLAGILVFGFAKVFGEPQVDHAIAFESAMDEAKAKADLERGIHDVEEPELVSRKLQASYGLLTGVMVYSTAFGGLFALVFSYANGRMKSTDSRVVSVLLAITGIIAVYMVPSIKYPANPLSVGNPDTIGMRTELYFIMMLVSLLGMIAATMLQGRLRQQYNAWTSTYLAGACYILIVFTTGELLPAVNEVPSNFPADLLWNFRIDSLGMQIIMWTTLGLGFGAFTEYANRNRFGYRNGANIQLNAH